MKKKICVIGLGEIGSSVFSELMNHLDKFDLVGVDIDSNKFDYNVAVVEYSLEPVPADVYIITVWTMDQIKKVLRTISPYVISRNALVSIESTIDTAHIKDLMQFIQSMDLAHDTIHVPHRWNPCDPEHGVFNQPRVIGAMSTFGMIRGEEFYEQFMGKGMLYRTTFETAAVAKVSENAYRAMEIILAQELKRSCEAHGYNFEDLREAMNSKWNIDVREARDGVKGKCLPKDLGIFTRTFPENVPARILCLLNEEFKKSCNTSS